MRWLWLGVTLLFLSIHGRADSLVTLDFTDFKVDLVPVAQFQPVGFGDYFLGATVPDAFGNLITGPDYGLYSAHTTGPFDGADVFPGNTMSGYGSPTLSMYSTTGFTNLSFNWSNNPAYIPPDQNFPVPIFFFDANNNQLASNTKYSFTGPASGFESINSAATAYSVSFGNPESTGEGRTWGFQNVTFDLVSLPDSPSNAPEPARSALWGMGIIGFGALLRKKKMTDRGLGARRQLIALPGLGSAGFAGTPKKLSELLTAALDTALSPLRPRRVWAGSNPSQLETTPLLSQIWVEPGRNQARCCKLAQRFLRDVAALRFCGLAPLMTHSAIPCMPGVRRSPHG